MRKTTRKTNLQQYVRVAEDTDLSDANDEKQDDSRQPDSFQQNIIKPACFKTLNSQTLTAIKKRFNSDDNDRSRSTIMTIINWTGLSFFRHRFLKQDELRLVQRNGIPELVSYSGQPERRQKVWSIWKPWTWFNAFRDNSSTLAVCNYEDLQTRGYIGYGDRHLVNVAQGQYAKVIIDGQAKLLDEGIHVIKTSNFRYNGLVNKSESYITYGNCHLLQVPAGKLVSILIDNKPYFLESGTHKFTSSNVIINKNGNNSIFFDRSEPSIKCGSLLRLNPKAGDVAVYYNGSEICIFPENGTPNKEPIIIDNPNVSYARTLNTSLQNRNYPGEHEKEEYYEYLTQDSVKVGVKFFVAYQIIDPGLALSKLRPGEIDNHIRHVTHADMAVAGQETSLQQILSTDMSSIRHEAKSEDTGSCAPSAPPFIRTWQDHVKRQLVKDLAEYGINLVRLNIEDIKILNPKVEAKLSEQSYGVADANSKLAAISMQADFARQKAQSEATVSTIKARAAITVAELRKQEALLVASAKSESQQLVADVYKSNPQLLELERSKIAATALGRAVKIISPEVACALLRANGLFAERTNGATALQVSDEAKLSA